MSCQRPRIRVRTATCPPSPLEECDACDGESCREGPDLAGENAARRAKMNDTSSCRREDTRLPVGEPYSRMAVECPALRVGNGEGDNAWTARKDPVVDEINGAHPAFVACLLGGRPDREEVERGARVHETDPGRICDPSEAAPVGHLREGDEPDSEVSECDAQSSHVNRRAEQLVEERVLRVFGAEGITTTWILAGEDGSGEVVGGGVGDRPLVGERGREVLVPGRWP